MSAAGWRAAIAQFVTEQSAARAVDIADIRQLGGGAIQENYALDVRVRGGAFDGRHAWVLRADAPSRVAASHSRAEEFALLQVAHDAGVLAPQPLWQCADPGLIGQPFYLMQRLTGTAAARDLVRGAWTEDQRNSLAQRLGQELARIHGIRPPQPRLSYLPKPGIASARSRVQQYRLWLDCLPDAHPVLEWGLRWLDVNALEADTVVLCHSDYRTGNYLVNDGELSGILDWEFANWGDRYEDLAWFCARCWRFGAWQFEAGGIADREPFYAGYTSESGQQVDTERVAYWEVMAAVRWSVIALQQAQRHCSGQEESLELALTGRIVPEMELDILQTIERIEAGERNCA
ncbi:MAG: phosphotransferase family protein [Gammaproteobacteria bacterium]|nr:phosphotransferase family protein [Gammaproteobacteria bacterium]